MSIDFLELVRLGIRDARDPLIMDTIAVVDAVLRRDLPQGPCWRRYNHDGYGQRDDGGPFDGTGIGRCWPLLTGERGHYELAAGRDPMPFIRAMEAFANDGGMLPEQVWDGVEPPEARMTRGGPTGSAMPLCWAHAEYLTLVRSRHDGIGFDFIPPIYERYVNKPVQSKVEVWTLAHQPPQMAAGKTLRLITERPATVHWSGDGWRQAQDQPTNECKLGLWYADLATDRLPASGKVVFTLHWEDRWEGKDFEVQIV